MMVLLICRVKEDGDPMSKVLMTRILPEPAAALMEEAGCELVVHQPDRAMTRGELLAAVPGCHAVISQMSDAIDSEFFDAAGPQLRVVANYAVGYNNIDVNEATRRGVRICNTPGVLTEATADIAWALLLAVTRRLIEGDQMVRGGRFDGWAPQMLLGGDLVGRNLFIVGAGRIGSAVARRAVGWQMRITYFSRTANRELEDSLGAQRVDLDDGLAAADFVSLHVPLTPQTHHLIDARRLALMKRTAYLVNTARGPVVDESALVEALREGHIAGAGLDVYEEEPQLAPGLAELPNVVLLPHLGSATTQTRRNMAELTAKNILAGLAEVEPPHAVN
jgi:glyoxylate reductase